MSFSYLRGWFLYRIETLPVSSQQALLVDSPPIHLTRQPNGQSGGLKVRTQIICGVRTRIHKMKPSVAKIDAQCQSFVSAIVSLLFSAGLQTKLQSITFLIFIFIAIPLLQTYHQMRHKICLKNRNQQRKVVQKLFSSFLANLTSIFAIFSFAFLIG